MGIIATIVERFSSLSSFAYINSIPKIFVSDISSSLFCEWKKYLEIKYGTEETQDMIRGKMIHQDYFRYEHIDFRYADELLASGKELSFTMKVGFIWIDKDTGRKVMLSGEPDSILFARDGVKKITELKTRRNSEVHSSDVLQVGIYGICIEKMLDISLDKVELEIRVKNIVNDDEISKTFFLGDIKMETKKKLTDILDFWLAKREPKIAESSSICRVCNFRKICDRKLIPI